MILNYLYNILTAVSLASIPLVSELNLTNPFVLVFLFFLFDVLPSAIAGLILSYIGVNLDYLSPTINTRLTFYLYPLYPIFFPTNRFGLAEIATWTVFFFPVFEEVLFFSTPALYGFVTGNYSMAFSMCLICGTFWTIIHLFRNASMMLTAGFTAKQIVLATLAGAIAYVPHVILASMLWTAGLGAISILFHSTHNALSVLGSLYKEKEREFLMRFRKHSKGKYYVLRKRKYFVFRE